MFADDILVSVWCEDFPAQFIEILIRNINKKLGQDSDASRGMEKGELAFLPRRVSGRRASSR